MKAKAFLLMLGLLQGCSTHTINAASPKPIQSLGQEIRVVVTGEDQTIVDQLSRHLKAKLLTEGLNVVDDEQATTLTVAISEFTPGNAALRLTIGFGAGRGSLVYNAKYTKGDQLLIDFDGAERFTGLEFEPGTEYHALGNLGGEETATQILLEEATQHIVELAGASEEDDRKAAEESEGTQQDAKGGQSAASATDRLRTLDRLLEEGLINQDDYDQKRREILDDL